MGLNKSRTPALGFSVSVRGTKCTAGAADGFSHVLLSMALSEPLRCLGTGLMLAEGNHHSYSKNPPCRRETMGFVPQLCSLPAVQFIVLAISAAAGAWTGCSFCSNGWQ